jgi:hypothetical protein
LNSEKIHYEVIRFKKEGPIKSLGNPLYREKKEIVPSLPRNLQRIQENVFKKMQAMEKKQNPRELLLVIMNKKIMMDFENKEKH